MAFQLAVFDWVRAEPIIPQGLGQKGQGCRVEWIGERAVMSWLSY